MQAKYRHAWVINFTMTMSCIAFVWKQLSALISYTCHGHLPEIVRQWSPLNTYTYTIAIAIDYVSKYTLQHCNDSINTHCYVTHAGNSKGVFCSLGSGPQRVVKLASILPRQSAAATTSLTLPSCSVPNLSVTYHKLKS